MVKHIKNPYQNLVMPLDAAEVRVKHKEQYCHFWCCTNQRLDASRYEDPFVQSGTITKKSACKCTYYDSTGMC